MTTRKKTLDGRCQRYTVNEFHTVTDYAVEHSPAEASEKYDVPYRTVMNWLEYRRKGVLPRFLVSDQPSVLPDTASETSILEREKTRMIEQIQRIEKTLKRLEEEKRGLKAVLACITASLNNKNHEPEQGDLS